MNCNDLHPLPNYTFLTVRANLKCKRYPFAHAISHHNRTKHRNFTFITVSANLKCKRYPFAHATVCPHHNRTIQRNFTFLIVSPNLKCKKKNLQKLAFICELNDLNCVHEVNVTFMFRLNTKKSIKPLINANFWQNI